MDATDVQDGQFVGPETPIEQPTQDDLDCPLFGDRALVADQSDHA
ncbi:hypothetical protein ACFV80_35925 [Streptomyces sp. NPDC059862]